MRAILAARGCRRFAVADETTKSAVGFISLPVVTNHFRQQYSLPFITREQSLQSAIVTITPRGEQFSYSQKLSNVHPFLRWAITTKDRVLRTTDAYQLVL